MWCALTCRVRRAVLVWMLRCSSGAASSLFLGATAGKQSLTPALLSVAICQCLYYVYVHVRARVFSKVRATTHTTSQDTTSRSRHVHAYVCMYISPACRPSCTLSSDGARSHVRRSLNEYSVHVRERWRRPCNCSSSTSHDHFTGTTRDRHSREREREREREKREGVSVHAYVIVCAEHGLRVSACWVAHRWVDLARHPLY